MLDSDPTVGAQGFRPAPPSVSSAKPPAGLVAGAVLLGAAGVGALALAIVLPFGGRLPGQSLAASPRNLAYNIPSLLLGAALVVSLFAKRIRPLAALLSL